MSRIIDELISKRADAVKNIQAFAAQAGGAPMDADLTAKFEAAKADFDNLDAQIKGLQATESVEDFESVPKADKKDGFLNFVRFGDVSNVKFENSVSSTSSSAGVLIPTDLSGEIIKKLYENNVMVNIADVMQISNPTDIAVSGTEPTAYWADEEGAYTDSSPTLTKISLTPHKIIAMVKASDEILEDAAFDVAAYISERSGIAIGRECDAQFFGGDGAGKPTGVKSSASVGVTSSATNSIAYSEIVNLFTSVTSPYRTNGKFVVSDAALRSIMLLQDGASQFVFQPSYTEGVPNMLLGKPMYTTANLEDVAAGKIPVLFGDFSYYKIAIRKALTMQRLVELYAGNGQVGFRFTMRVDGKLTDTSAVKSLKMKAS